MIYILTSCYPNGCRMSISTSCHSVRDSVVDELIGIGFSHTEVLEIMGGETYDDGDGWYTRVTTHDISVGAFKPEDIS